MASDPKQVDKKIDSVDKTVLRGPWNDPELAVEKRVNSLLEVMNLHEKVSQLTSIWIGATTEGQEVAPQQNEMMDYVDFNKAVDGGIGQVTRPYGTAPVSAKKGARRLSQIQREIVKSNRFGIPAFVHEECLSGFTAYGATTYPIPLSWGASFNPELIENMAKAIGSTMHELGVHQGLSPLMDVTRDLRWGRCEETIGEDPYLVGSIGTAYVKGLQKSGIVATLKHFAGYSASKGGKNHSPSQISTRELFDVFLPPFEMAISEGHAQSVMPAYTAIDGVPCSENRALLTDVLRKDMGFDGTVVSDYFAIIQLAVNQHTASDPTEAARLAFMAGMDVELPGMKCFDEDFEHLIESGDVPIEMVNAAVGRVLRQKIEYGLMDEDWNPDPHVLRADMSMQKSVDLDPPENRALARHVAEESVILLKNDGVLPLDANSPKRIAIIGPAANDYRPFLGCYSFEMHVRANHPECEPGIRIPTVLDRIRDEFPLASISYAQGTSILAHNEGAYPDEKEQINEAAALAASSDVAIVVVGDIAGLFGAGTTGEGSDDCDLHLAGHQQELVQAVEATNTPVVLVLLTGKPRILSEIEPGASAILQGFYLGEEGAEAVTKVISGAVNPSGKLPVSVPLVSGLQPSTYWVAPIERNEHVTDVDSSALFPFGFGLSYTSWALSDVCWGATRMKTDGSLDVEMTLTNTGEHAGAQVLQLYVEDDITSVVRPIKFLAGYCKLHLDPGASKRIHCHLSSDVLSFVGKDYRRIVEPGTIQLVLGFDSEEVQAQHTVQVTGPVREVGSKRDFAAEITVLA